MQGILRRIYYALGPLGAGIILDALDLATFGPIGLGFGALIGGYVGWQLAGFEGFGSNARIAVACLAGIYMTIPRTEVIPVATILGLVGRFFKGPPVDQVADEGEEDGPVVDVAHTESDEQA